jgi:alpha-L-fucosidase
LAGAGAFVAPGAFAQAGKEPEAAARPANPPFVEANLARPTPQQLAWQDMEFGMFCHFGINTFNDKEWSDGTISPKTFNPTELDADQWVKAAHDANIKYFMLTAKHHDGFCLWPTATTDYSVKSSPWRDGKGDVVGLAAEACRKYGVGFGLYLSPWDRHEPCYKDKEAYDKFYARQLTELVTRYGKLVEIWFDGAGSEGRTYNWPMIMEVVHKRQPGAMVFNMGQPTIRWVGNEDGYAPDPCWCAVEANDVLKFSSGGGKPDPRGAVWLPAECDARIRRNWFWHPTDAATLKSLDRLMDIYYRSVGHNANLLLNIGPDNRGLLPEQDVARLLEMAKEIERRFRQPLGAVEPSGKYIVLDFDDPTVINHAVLMEDLREGQRVLRYQLEASVEGDWVKVHEGTSIGHKKIARFEAVRAAQLRFQCLERLATPKIRSFQAFHVAA